MSRQILVAPLNWGLGHATRCIPIINALLENNFTPILASDGMALKLLRKEFPDLKFIELPTYNITYPKNKHVFILKMLQQMPRMLKAIKIEKKLVKELVENQKIDGIISDNRLGIYNKNVPSVFITHQLQVLSGKTTWLSTKLHERFIRNFDICWIPDCEKTPNLSGKLGHTPNKNIPIKYIGALSRFSKKERLIKNDILVLLSGPEPQRSILERKLLVELKYFKGSILFVKGVVETQQTVKIIDNLTIYNFMTSNLLEDALNESELIISRSGYTSIMDLAKLKKSAFLIPTPGQFEQEYLAARLDNLGLVPSCSQDEFTLDKLESVSKYKGLPSFDDTIGYNSLFGLFHAK